MNSSEDLGTCAIEAQHRVECQKMPPARAYSLPPRALSDGTAENALCRQRNHLKIGLPGRLRGAHWLSAGWAELETAESRLGEVQQERSMRSCLESCVDRLQANRVICWFRLLMYCAYGLLDGSMFSDAGCRGGKEFCGLTAATVNTANPIVKLPLQHCHKYRNTTS